MKEFKGTKGEWKVKDDFREPSILNEDNCVIFTHNNNCSDEDEDFIQYYSHNKMMANAKLIAAAPELLEELITLLSNIDEMGNTGEDMRELRTYLSDARKAINKALK